MGNFADGKVYEKLGVRPMINAVGNSTMLGGSTPSDMIKQAMEEASHGFVDMGDLTAKAGDYIAGLLGTEAAYPTSGCAAAMTLSSAVVMTGNDVEKMGRLPDTTGMKNEILIQSAQRYAADPCFRFAGREAGRGGEHRRRDRSRRRREHRRHRLRGAPAVHAGRAFRWRRRPPSRARRASRS